MIKQFFIWFRLILAKEILASIICVLLSSFLVWISHEILVGKHGSYIDKKLEIFGITKLEYFIYLFIFYMILIYGIRFVEGVIKTVVKSKEIV